MQVIPFTPAEVSSFFREILKRCFSANFKSSDTKSPGQGLDCPQQDELVRDLLDDGYSAKGTSTVRQLEGYLLNRRDCLVECAVIEEMYIDRDFLDDFNSYHSRCYDKHPSRCCRVHFFSKKITSCKTDTESLVKLFERLILSPDGKNCLQEAYLGFMIVRPLRKTVVGRTCLKPYPQTDSGGAGRTRADRHYLAICENHVSFYGVDITVDCMPFQEQDGSTSACATCSLWSAFCVSATLFRNGIPSPSVITALAMENSSSRAFPNQGLSVEEMGYAIRKTGLDPVVMQLDNYTNVAERAYMFLGAVYAYLNLGVSVIAVLDDDKRGGAHAIAINGYNLMGEDECPASRKWLSAMRIDKFYANDDQCCPGARFKLRLNAGVKLKIEAYRGPSDKSELYRVYIPRSLIIPIYRRIHVSFEEVAKEVHDCIGILNKAKESLRTGWGCIQLDITLRESNKFKAEIKKDDDLNDEDKFQIVMASLPRFVWCVRINYSGAKAVTVLIDTTDSEQGLTVVAVLFYNCPINPQTEINEHVIRFLARRALSCMYIGGGVNENLKKIGRQSIVKALCDVNSKDIRELREKADGGDATAQCVLGDFYEYGEGVTLDKNKAVEYYMKAAEQNDSDALFRLGRMCEPRKEAVGWYKRVEEQNGGFVKVAQFRIGRIYEQCGEEGKACEYYEKVADIYIEAQYRLAEIYRRKGDNDSERPNIRSQHYANMVKWYKCAAGNGNKDAQYQLGISYKNGLIGVQQNAGTAFCYFDKAAHQEHAKAQYELAEMYREGLSENGRDIVGKNLEEALRWYKAAAEQECANAAYKLGKIYEDGSIVVPRDIDKAIAWYVVAAEKNHGDAQFRLGSIFEKGKYDTISAVEWYEKASSNCNASDQLRQEASGALDRLKKRKGLCLSME